LEKKKAENLLERCTNHQGQSLLATTEKRETGVKGTLYGKKGKKPS